MEHITKREEKKRLQADERMKALTDSFKRSGVDWGQASVDGLNRQVLKREIERKEKEMNEYWEALKKHDPTTYSYPFHQARAIDELKKKLANIK